jgi:hypothetical protein
MNEVNKEEMLAKFQAMVDALSQADLPKDVPSFVRKVYELDAVAAFLI